METDNVTRPTVTTSITPFLVVDNGAAALDFYQAAFHGTIKASYARPDGKLTAKIVIEGAEFWVGDEEPEYDNLGPVSIGGSPVRIVLVINDPDEIYTRAIELGAVGICPVTTEESWKIGKLKDPFGHIWEIGHPL